MCTLSWFYSGTDYQLFFNRDEQKSREIAEIPKYFHYPDKTKALMPIDPRGNGSWISVNSYGLSLALLNFYQGQLPVGKLLSRGQIIKQAANKDSLQQVAHFLQRLPLQLYPPFSLLAFDRRRSGPTQFMWTGVVFKVVEEVESPVISSGFDFEKVLAARLSQYRACVANDMSCSSLLEFHRSHKPSRSAYSVCMHRDDAETVSHTQIKVGNKVEVKYYPGAPCFTLEANIKYYSFELV